MTRTRRRGTPGRQLFPFKRAFSGLVALLAFGAAIQASNPIIKDRFTADPAALVSGGRVYLYTGQDDAPAGVFNANDDSGLKMGEWFDVVADVSGLPRPPRVARAEAAGKIPPGLLSFMSESRRLDNRRLKEILGVRLRYEFRRDFAPYVEAYL